MQKASVQREWTAPTTAKTVHVTFLVDRSGSMEAIRSDVIGGFNKFLHDQQAQDGECRLTVHQFDSNGFDTLFSGLEITDVRDATMADFEPRGCTPLFDAIGRAIARAEVRALSAEGKHEQPLIVILTDGLENASEEFTGERIFKLIKAKEKKGWIFTYLGANQDAYAMGGAMGIDPKAVQNYLADEKGTQAAFDSVSDAVGYSRVRAAAGDPLKSSTLYEETGKGAEADQKRRSKNAPGSKRGRPRSWSSS
jgi:uncharacterized protein YegL